jgi:hypothetical protein
VLSIEQVKKGSKAEVRRFVQFPFKLYRNCPQWVPPLFVDA